MKECSFIYEKIIQIVELYEIQYVLKTDRIDRQRCKILIINY